MKRNYVAWYKRKAELETEQRTGLFARQEIWWCALGANIGDEEDGKNDDFERPVLILRKYNKRLFLGLPMTSKLHEGKFYVQLDVKDVQRSVMLSQGRTLSAYRLLRKIYKVNDNDFARIEKAYTDLTFEKPKKTIPASELAGSQVPNGSLYTDNIKRERKSQGNTSVEEIK